MKRHYFTEEETSAWLEMRPKKTIAAKVIIAATNGDVLVVKPNYKKGWNLPGGGVDKNEDPREAAVREVSEEIGLRIKPEELSLAEAVFDSRHDGLFLLYVYNHLLSSSHEFKLNYAELDDYAFHDKNTVAAELTDIVLPENWRDYLSKIA